VGDAVNVVVADGAVDIAVADAVRHTV